MTDQMRRPAEVEWASEIAALQTDDGPRPEDRAKTPRAVVTYLLGGTAPDGTAITAKYVGSRRLIETAVATLPTDPAASACGARRALGRPQGAGQRLIRDADPRRAVDDWICALDEEDYVAHLPLMRRVFSGMDRNERRALLERVLGRGSAALRRRSASGLETTAAVSRRRSSRSSSATPSTGWACSR